MVRNQEILTAEQINASIEQMTQEILADLPQGDLFLLGMATRGVPLSQRISKKLGEYGIKSSLGSLDTTFYRDDYHFRKKFKNPSMHITQIPETKVDGVNIVLIDDVIYTGRSIRSALNAIMDLGRPASIHLGVLVDRGGREMPIEPRYVGLKCPTYPGEEIKVRLEETDSVSTAWVVPMEEV